MFGKKTPNSLPVTSSSANASSAATKDKSENNDPRSSAPLKPSSRKGQHGPSKPLEATPPKPKPPMRSRPEIPSPSNRHIDRPRGNDIDSNCLVIGRDICLKGEITSCDKLIVEGVVDVMLPAAHTIEVLPSGHFTGTAEVSVADISGRFDGELVALERLIVRAGGNIKGKIRYGRIVIESGGEVIGDMQALERPDN